jgi:hypothetical protein
MFDEVEMMKYILSMMLVFLLPVVAVSDWIVISLESGVNTSDIIVVGTLRDVSEETRDGIDYGTGEIIVDEVLWGNIEPGQKLVLVWQNESNIDCPRVEHRAHQNKQAVWLLNVKPEGKVAADNPGRFVSIEKKAKVLELLRERRKT